MRRFKRFSKGLVFAVALAVCASNTPAFAMDLDDDYEYEEEYGDEDYDDDGYDDDDYDDDDFDDEDYDEEDEDGDLDEGYDDESDDDDDSDDYDLNDDDLNDDDLNDDDLNDDDYDEELDDDYDDDEDYGEEDDSFYEFDESWVWHEEKEATCTERGNYEGYWMDPEGRCFLEDEDEYILVEDEDDLFYYGDHEPDEDAWVDGVCATCSTTGIKDHGICTGCNKIIVFNEDEDADSEYVVVEDEEDLIIPVDPTMHDPQEVEGADATCTKAGVKAHYKCVDCGKLFADEEGEEEITAKDIVIPAKGHSLKRVAKVAATYKKAGTKAHYECKDCHKCFTDAKGKNKATKKALTIPKLKKVTRITVPAAKKNKVTVKAKKSVNLTAKVTPSDATNKKVTYKIKDTRIAKVSKTGKVTGLKKGTTTLTITAKDGSKKSCSIKIVVK